MIVARMVVYGGEKRDGKVHARVTMRRGGAVEASEGATLHLRMSRTPRRPARAAYSSETRNTGARHVVRRGQGSKRGSQNPPESRGHQERCRARDAVQGILAVPGG